MKAADLIVDRLVSLGVTDVFGYPGGMVTHLMDAMARRDDVLSVHTTYHEQGAAFAACGYAQSTGKLGVAYATSGPGATNLITGICNAFFDSIPVLLITGQVNTGELKDGTGLRQRGFQETNIVSLVSSVTKYATRVDDPALLFESLDRAISCALTGRPGPVLLDIPMNVLRSELSGEADSFCVKQVDDEPDSLQKAMRFLQTVEESLASSLRPCLLIGAGVKTAHQVKQARRVAAALGIPAVSSMLAVDVLTREDPQYFGFIGAYGDRCANFVIAKSDLVISLGARLDVRQVGGARENFAPHAQIIRVDIDECELAYGIHDNDLAFQMGVSQALDVLDRSWAFDWTSWVTVCETIRRELSGIDIHIPNQYVQAIGERVENGSIITADVGQNQVWVAQSFECKNKQKVLFSGGLGSMGYALPAGIGAYYGARCPVVCFCGDGGMQMNIQELQFVVREKLPLTVVVFNNQSLGMIRHFQEMYFDGRYEQTVSAHGYTTPNFVAIARAYGITARRIESLTDIEEIDFTSSTPQLVEVILPNETYVHPKLEFGKPNQDQEPLLARELYDKLMEL